MNNTPFSEDEKLQTLLITQALLGAVNEDLRAVCFNCGKDVVQLTFVLFRDGEVSQEDIEDIVFEYTEMRSDQREISVLTLVEPIKPIGEITEKQRLVFNRKAIEGQAPA